MKKASKLLLALLIAAALVFTFIGCDGDGDGEDETPETWSLIWYETKADPGLHFHVNDGALIVQKVILNNTKTATGAYVLFDFTATPAFDDDDIYWMDALPDFVKDIGTAKGRYELKSSGDHVWGGGFGCAPLDGPGYAFMGFYVLDGAELGDARIVNDGETKFSDM